MVAIIVVTGAVAAARFTPLVAGRDWPPPELMRVLTGDVALFDFAALVLLAGIIVPKTMRKLAAPASFAQRLTTTLGWSLVIFSLAVSVISGFRLVAHAVAGAACCPFAPEVPGPPIGAPWDEIGPAAIWIVAIGASYFGRGAIVQYVGDVAAYVSAHSVNKFWEVRESIRSRTWETARAIYGARAQVLAPAGVAVGTPPGSAQAAQIAPVPGPTTLEHGRGAFLYDSVVVVGHSLGSVVAYDALNRLVADDIMAQNSGPGTSRDAARRTELFLTYGSPLDKIAFFFFSQRRSGAEVEDALIEAKQPLVSDYAHRPGRWINIWSENDLISGPVRHFDRPPLPGDPPYIEERRVEDVMDEAASTPLMSHVEYEANGPFAAALHGGVIGAIPAPLYWPTHPAKGRDLRAGAAATS